jgi:rRNA maturation endonuclease Nob1
MLLVSLIDGDLANKEKKAMLAFAKVVKLSQEQINTIVSETKKFVRAMTAETKCNACGVSLPAGSKFCTECGQKIQT